MGLESIGTAAHWVGFTAFILVMLAIDLVVFHRRPHQVNMREALIWTMVWITLALAFGAYLFFGFGSQPALEYLTGYLIEKALSVDNLFVFLVIFSYFTVPPSLQHRVLFWGILGALVTRAIFIVAGAALLQNFHWLMYVFGAFLAFTGIKLLVSKESEVHPERNPVLRLFRKLVPATSDYRGAKFTVREAGRRMATPLLMVLVVVEATDVVFAVDSIPAIFGVTADPFIVYTSNIFAILGLRALYFVLAGFIGKFRYLKVGLGLVLAFIGAKMLLVDVFKVPVAASLGVVAALLGGSIVVSLLRPEAKPPLPVEGPR